MSKAIDRRKIRGFCGLCIARCGTIATVEDGRFTRLDPDPDHPTGAAICAKGRAAPELVYAKERLTRPLRRKSPKGVANPEWEEISWEEALSGIASKMREIAAKHGPEAVAFSHPSPSTTAIGDSAPFLRRLMNAFGSPNLAWTLDLCGWGRGFATRYAYGLGAVATGGTGGAMADIARSGCLILWGYNPSMSRLTHATATVEALKRGMKLIVIDPRNVGLANKADVWLRVRPGTDGALALGLANVLIERGWFDESFIRSWSNGPLLVRSDTGRLLRESDLGVPRSDGRFVAWDTSRDGPTPFDPTSGTYIGACEHLALRGSYRVDTPSGAIECRPVFDHYAELCRQYPADVIDATCWLPKDQLEEAARLIWHARPTSYYAWSGHEQHANTTENARAISLLYALTGSFDEPGGNVRLPGVESPSITGEDLPAAKQMAPAVGVEERPLGPARWNNVSTLDFYRAVLDGAPYPVRGMINFGANLLLAQSDPDRGRKAFAALDFYAHADLFMSPTAEQADIVLPIASCFEREALKIGFEIDETTQSHVQFRQAVARPPGEARPDIDVIFELAMKLGLGEHFWNGDVEAAYRHQLGPSGVSLEDLRANPGGLHVPLTTEHRQHAELDAEGHAVGFPTPSRKIEFWSEPFLDHGHAALPAFVEPSLGPMANPDLAARFPLVLTCAKPSLFCQTQHRALPSLRKRAPHPEVEVHPEAARDRGITAGAWVMVTTPAGGMRARAKLNEHLDPRVVVGEHGWWQACDELGLSGYDPFSNEGSNFNRTVDPSVRDPVSGTPGHRANLCQLEPMPAPSS
ncbi:MAG: molybdopterin-containing oxidoreductase family protein [Hyphomicrobiaceae bacterium]